MILLTCLWIIWGNIDNDVQDYELDFIHKNKRSNHFILWLISNGHPLLFERLLLILCISISVFISTRATLVTVVAWSGLKFYNLYFKKMPLVGNLIIAALCSMSLHVFQFQNTCDISTITCLIFLTTLLRELIKDKEDEHADKAMGYKTLAILCSAFTFKIILLTIGIIILILAFQYMHSIKLLFGFFVFLQMSQWYFIYKNEWKHSSLITKMQIASGIFSIVFV